VLDALRQVRDAAIEAGDYGEAIDWCRRMLEIEPWLEETYRALMVCHARLEQRGRVKSWYDLCVRRLREELEVDPEHATRLVFEQAMQGRLQGSTRRAAVPAGRPGARRDALGGRPAPSTRRLLGATPTDGVPLPLDRPLGIRLLVGQRDP
jgi:DNA-binding SARP family transcriptional activator